MTQIYLIRHGNTEDTGIRISGYRPGVHLNEVGKSQTERIARFIKTKPFIQFL